MNRKELKQEARQRVTQTQGSPKKVTLVFLLVLLGMGVLRFSLLELVEHIHFEGHYLSQAVSAEAKVMVISWAVSFGMQMLMLFWRLGYTVVALQIKDGGEFSTKTLLSGFQGAGRSILADVLMSVFLALWASLWAIPVSYGLTLVLGLGAGNLGQEQTVILAVVSGVILLAVLSYRYRMLFFLLMDDDRITARQALRQTVAMNRGHRWQLFRLDLSFLPWMLLGCLTCGVVLIWKLPAMVTTYALVYDGLKEEFQKKQEKYREMLEQMLHEG